MRPTGIRAVSRVFTTARCRSTALSSLRLAGAGSPHASASAAVVSRRRFSGFSMELLKELRAQSGAPIVECKKALQNTSGDDISEAMNWLREHGAAKATSKVQGRETTEGLVGLQVSEDGKSAALVKVSSETDFACRSDMFVNLVNQVAGATLESVPARDDSLERDVVMGATRQGKTVKEYLDEAIVAIRENLSVADARKLQSSDGEDNSMFVGYVHNRIGASNAGTSAAVVEVCPAGGTPSLSDDETLRNAGKKLAMHIVAAKPRYLSSSDVPDDEVNGEREILLRQMEDSGKPKDIVDKIVAGRLRKFYEEICLLEQPHMIEEKNPKVEKVLKDAGIVVRRFQSLSIS